MKVCIPLYDLWEESPGWFQVRRWSKEERKYVYVTTLRGQTAAQEFIKRREKKDVTN